MIQGYEKIYLNEKALAYVTEQLGLAGALSDLLIDFFRNSKVQIWGYFPKEISETDLIEFQYGGKILKNVRPEYADVVLQYLKTNINSVWMLVDNVGNSDYPPEDNNIKDVTTVCFYNKTVIHFLNIEPITLERIQKTFTSGGAYPFIGFITNMTSLIEKEIIENRLQKESIEYLVENISMLVLSAYDEEGYLIVEINK